MFLIFSIRCSVSAFRTGSGCKWSAPSVDKIYYSAMLAHTFAADNFTDNNGTLVQPGLFDVNYFYVSNNDTSHFNELLKRPMVRLEGKHVYLHHKYIFLLHCWRA